MKKLSLAACAVCVLLATSCGAGIPNIVVPAPVVLAFEPETVFSHQSTAVRLLGTGFGARSTKVVIRFTADSGTPFDGGTSATYELEGNVDSAQQIRTDLDPTLFATAFRAFITLILENGLESTSATPIATFIPQTVTSMTPDDTPSAANVPFTLTGSGFQPPEALVSIRFEAETGTPFLGGGSATLETNGSVTSPTTISGLLPHAFAAVDAPAFVVVIFPEGEIRSPTPVVTFRPSLAVLSFDPAVTSSGLTPPFTVTGTKFEPPAAAATVTLTATIGTPFANGTSATAVFAGTVTSPTTIAGTLTPDTMVNAETLANVTVQIGPDSAQSVVPLAQIFPAPTISGITPNVIEAGDPTYPFTIQGANFTPTGGNCTVTLIADAGTPFNQGADATISTPGTIQDSGEIGCSFNNPDVDVDTDCTVRIDFPSGALAISAPGLLHIDREPPFQPPVWDPVFGTAINGGADNDDGFQAVNFTGGFTFDFWGVNYSTVYVGSNGFLTFGSGDTDLSESSSEMRTDQPRIAGYWDDLRPTGSQEPKFKQLADRAVITFDRVPEYFSSGQKSFQFTLWETGRIDIFYLSMTGSTQDGIIGISPGNSLKNAQAFDFSTTTFPTWTDVPVANFPYERWTSGGPDLDPNGWISFVPLGPSFDGSDGYQFTTGP